MLLKNNFFSQKANSEFAIAVNRYVSRPSFSSPKGSLYMLTDEAAIKVRRFGSKRKLVKYMCSLCQKKGCKIKGKFNASTKTIG